MRARPHECADDRLWEEETGGVAGPDPGDLDVRRHADDADAVAGRGARAGGVGAVPVFIVPRRRTLVRYALIGAGHAVREIDVGGEVGVRVVEASVDVTYGHGPAAALYRLRLEGVDLRHVPLPPGHAVPPDWSGPPLRSCGCRCVKHSIR